MKVNSCKGTGLSLLGRCIKHRTVEQNWYVSQTVQQKHDGDVYPCPLIEQDHECICRMPTDKLWLLAIVRQSGQLLSTFVTKHTVYIVTAVLLSIFSGTCGHWQSKNIKQKIIGRNNSEVLSCIQL